MKSIINWNILIWLGNFFAMGMGAGCAEENSVCGLGHDGVPVIVENEEDLDTFWIGRVGVDELNQLNGPDPGHSTLVQAHLMDFYNYRVVLADRMPFSEEGGCYLYTSRPVVLKHCQPSEVCSEEVLCPEGYSCRYGRCLPKAQACDDQGVGCPGIQVCENGVCISPECGDCPTPGYECVEDDPVALQTEKIVFEGLSGGAIELIPDAESFQVPTKILPGRAMNSDSISIRLFSQEAEYSFPEFELSVATPSTPKPLQVGEVSNPDLQTGFQVGINTDRQEPLRITWEPGAGDYFEILLVPGSGSSTTYKKLRCVTFDDGCLEVPAEALWVLAADSATNFQLKMERHQYRLHSIRVGEQTQAAVIVDVSSAVEGTVRR